MCIFRKNCTVPLRAVGAHRAITLRTQGQYLRCADTSNVPVKVYLRTEKRLCAPLSGVLLAKDVVLPLFLAEFVRVDLFTEHLARSRCSRRTVGSPQSKQFRL